MARCSVRRFGDGHDHCAWHDLAPDRCQTGTSPQRVASNQPSRKHTNPVHHHSFQFELESRLEFAQKKITENIECEIMQVLLEEARESYNLNIVHEVRSDNVDDLENNVELVEKWCQNWISTHTTSAAQ